MGIIKFRAWFENNCQMFYSDDMPGDCPFAKFFQLANRYKMPIMQFTGLTDKNGKEIYEGDILASPHTHLLFTVAWDAANARFHANARNINCSAQFWAKRTVIGNVYQNGREQK